MARLVALFWRPLAFGASLVAGFALGAALIGYALAALGAR